jgi:uncharacterized Zn finger protein (UPF0148 family)
MTNEPKVRAEVYPDKMRNDNDRFIVNILVGDNYSQRCRDLTEAEAELIASKINAPDPIAIRQQALKEVGEKVEAFKGHISWTFYVTPESERGAREAIDEVLLIIKSAIDQLRNKGEKMTIKCCETCGFNSDYKGNHPCTICNVIHPHMSLNMWATTMTNEPKDNPDKVGYEKARDELIDCAINRYALVESLAEHYCDVILAEGERRAVREAIEIIEKQIEKEHKTHGEGTETYILYELKQAIDQLRNKENV